MARIIILIGGRTSGVAVETDDGLIWEIPFFQESQAFDFFDISHHERAAFPRLGLRYEAVAGGPVGYAFFALKEGEKIVGVVVWGPYGVLPSIYQTLAEAISAAEEDAELNSSSRPTVSLRLPGNG